MIKIFILTYNAPDELDQNLKSLFACDFPKNKIEINIINNHSQNFKIDPIYSGLIIHHQTLRADWGCGTPARDWNQALVLGFKSLKFPLCEQIILCQNDCIWDIDWYSKLENIHISYDFYQCSWGDCFISIKPSAIKKIGLFDERMCSLGYYEGDFLIRAWLYNRNNSSINDHHHKRVWNPTISVANRSSSSRPQPPYTDLGKKIFELKWPNITAKNWDKGLFKVNPLHSAYPNYIFYPYFEYDIENLKEKNYILP